MNRRSNKNSTPKKIDSTKTSGKMYHQYSSNSAMKIKEKESYQTYSWRYHPDTQNRKGPNSNMPIFLMNIDATNLNKIHTGKQNLTNH